MVRRTVPLFLAALLTVTGCDRVQEAVDPPARAGDAAREFALAWSERDAGMMAARLTNAEEWHAQRLESFLARALPHEVIDSVEVAVTGEVPQPADEALIEDLGPQAATSAPYSVTYSSEASGRDVTFEGEMDLSYERSTDAWTVDFASDLLWPEHAGAMRFAIEERWPRRAAILDRSGRKLASGGEGSRRYPFGTLAGTTVGHLEPAQDMDRLAGASGLELALDEELAGTPTLRLVLLAQPKPRCRERAKDQRSRSKPSKDKRAKAPDCEPQTLDVLGRVAGERGSDIKTTLDVDVQRAAEGAYGATTGGSIVMDPETGDLLAVVSSASFDPGNYVGVAGIEPFNRALSGLYPPGSSLKVMTGAAALAEGVVRESTRLTGPAEYKGVRNFESGEFGSLDFATAVKFSVNTAFAQIAEDLGAKRLTRYADLFGFNEEPTMSLGAATSSFPFPEDEGDVMWGSIGQAQVLATPLQMATVAATIANNGKRMEPRILLKGSKRGQRVVPKKVAATMTRLMESVVEGGTGTGAQIAAAQVAGKTGTAEVDVNGTRKNHAWFIAFAPSSAPKVAVSVVSELGGIGGRVAAPLAGRILAAVLPLVK